MKLIVAVSGASGVQYAIALLEFLKKKKVETHLIVSEWAEELVREETDFDLKKLSRHASKVYGNNDMKAPLASGSFLVDGMVVIPCTLKTASEIANAHCGTLIARAADNILKSRKKLIVCIRETPLSTPALEQLYKLSLAGAIVMPLSPAFYHSPKNINDLISFITGKIADLLGIDNNEFRRWGS